MYVTMYIGISSNIIQCDKHRAQKYEALYDSLLLLIINNKSNNNVQYNYNNQRRCNGWENRVKC
jgi:hypothetical protein